MTTLGNFITLISLFILSPANELSWFIIRRIEMFRIRVQHVEWNSNLPGTHHVGSHNKSQHYEDSVRLSAIFAMCCGLRHEAEGAMKRAQHVICT